MELIAYSKPFWNSVISSGRSKNLPKMCNLIGPATWYVPYEEAQTYRKVAKEHSLNVEIKGSSKGVANQHNAALDEGFALGLPVATSDDDLSDVVQVITYDNSVEYRRHSLNNKSISMHRKISYIDAVNMMLNRLNATGLYLAGTKPDSQQLGSRPYGYSHRRVICGLIVVRPTPLRFDNTYPLNSDIEFFLQHMLIHHGAIQCSDILAKYKRWTGDGGAVALRNDDTAKLCHSQLISNYQGLVKNVVNKKNPFKVQFDNIALKSLSQNQIESLNINCEPEDYPIIMDLLVYLSLSNNEPITLAEILYEKLKNEV